eukprot:scaffold32936_cov129-Isochrysis_galbana.AAC.1
MAPESVAERFCIVHREGSTLAWRYRDRAGCTPSRSAGVSPGSTQTGASAGIHLRCCPWDPATDSCPQHDCRLRSHHKDNPSCLWSHAGRRRPCLGAWHQASPHCRPAATQRSSPRHRDMGASAEMRLGSPPAPSLRSSHTAAYLPVGRTGWRCDSLQSRAGIAAAKAAPWSTASTAPVPEAPHGSARPTSPPAASPALTPRIGDPSRGSSALQAALQPPANWSCSSAACRPSRPAEHPPPP